jgi:hypothetical protein
VLHALTSRRSDPTLLAHESVVRASVMKLTPRQRTKVAEDILSMFLTLSGGL